MSLILLVLSALPQKEVLTYDVNLGPVYAGEMRLSVIETEFEGKACYRFRSVLNSLPDLDWLVTINDTLYSYVTKDSFKTLYFEKRMHEKNYDTLIRVRYDWGEGVIKYEDGATYPLDPGTLDIVSIYYYFRINPLKLGEQRTVILHADRKTDKAIVKAVSETQVRSSASKEGSFLCTKLVPEVSGKSGFGPGGTLIFYLTKDGDLSPALIKTVMTIGSITARLKWVWKE